MPRYEYKVVPAPTKGLKAKGVRSAEARFAHAVQELMNGLSGYGWEYLRAETLPSLERAGLTGTTTEWRNVLVFRRPREGDVEDFAPELLAAPTIMQPMAQAANTAEASAVPVIVVTPPEKPALKATPIVSDKVDAEGEEAWDNGVEDTDDIVAVSSSLEHLANARKSLKPET